MRKILILFVAMISILMVGCEETKHIDITELAQKLTLQTLKQDKSVKDVAIDIKEDDATVCIAIKANDEVNKEKATELIDMAVRQLAFHCGGKTPSKEYLGELWECYTVKVLVFNDMNEQIAIGIKAAGQHNHVIVE